MRRSGCALGTSACGRRFRGCGRGRGRASSGPCASRPAGRPATARLAWGPQRAADSATAAGCGCSSTAVRPCPAGRLCARGRLVYHLARNVSLCTLTLRSCIFREFCVEQSHGHRRRLCGPVVDAVSGVSSARIEVAKQASDVVVVGLVLEAQTAGVLEEEGKLSRQPFAKNRHGHGHLLLHDLLVLFLPRVRHDALPGQPPANEIQQHVRDRLQVVAPTLLFAQVVVDARVARGAGEALVLTERDVHVRLGVAVPLGQAEVDHKHPASVLADAHEEVVWLDISMDEVPRVHKLDPIHHLLSEHQHRLE
mmetsp:Transcript_20117/g.64156  ORF Transcript_20117/g.64156 Transcript_20117/m.64156 type:complete len:309 (+) Transcript_20117:718-1644(+)